LRSALEELVGEDVGLLDVDQLADDLAELELVIGLLEAERLRRIASFESMNGPGRFGYPSLVSGGIGAGASSRRLFPDHPDGSSHDGSMDRRPALR
jgi:hypothetical protein